MKAVMRKFAVLAKPALPAMLALLLVSAGCASPPSSSPVPTQTPGPTPTQTVAEGAETDLDQARKALVAFFDALNEGRYTDAVPLYGGDYDVLRDWNPDTASDDYSKLLQSGCEVNGLRCLKVRRVVRQEQVSPTEFRFVVEFTSEDGTLFRRGPCCGASETDQPTQTQFDYTVTRTGDRFLVQSLPVYVP
jgi:hypothetical protein